MSALVQANSQGRGILLQSPELLHIIENRANSHYLVLNIGRDYPVCSGPEDKMGSRLSDCASPDEFIPMLKNYLNYIGAIYQTACGTHLILIDATPFQANVVSICIAGYV